jgi:hypothetical protein
MSGNSNHHHSRRVPPGNRPPSYSDGKPASAVQLRAVLRSLSAEFDAMADKAEKFRRMIYAILEARGGRIEIDRSEYLSAIGSDPPDTIWKVEPDGSKVVFVLSDEHGNAKSTVITLPP